VGFGIWYFVFRDDRFADVDELVSQAREAMGTFEYGRAEILLKDAIALSPGSGLLHHNLAVNYVRQGRIAEARREFETALALYPPEANEVRAEENWQLAQLDFQERNWQDAETHLERAIADHPTRALLHHRLIDLQLLGTQRVSAADSSTMRFLKFCGATPENLRDAAQIHLRRGSFRSAIQLSRQAISLSDTMVSAHVILGTGLWRAGHLEEALEEVDDALERFPGSVDLLNVKSGVLVGLKRFDDALEAIDYALRIDPSHYDANVTRMMALSLKGDYEAALEQCRRCQEMTDDETELRFLRTKLRQFLAIVEGEAQPEEDP
jgi:tetratricopeptide (TPR) repeat protein